MSTSTQFRSIYNNGPSTMQVAVNSSQLSESIQNQMNYVYVSTIEGVNKTTNPNYRYQYKSQTERIQSIIGRIAQNRCS